MTIAPPSTIAEVRDLRAAYLTEAYGVHRAVYALESINLTIKTVLKIRRACATSAIAPGNGYES